MLGRVSVAVQLLAVAAVSVFLGYRGVQPLVFRVPHGNGLVLHQLLTSRVAETGGSHNPWVPHWGGGAAVLQFSAPLAHVFSAALSGVAGAFGASVDETVVLVNALFLAALPWAAWLGLRGLGLRRWACTAAAVAVALVDADREAPLLMGMQLRCFTWEGAGLMPRLLGVVFAFVSLGTTLPYVAAASGSLPLASLFLSLAWLSDFGVGYGASVILLAAAASAMDVAALGRWVAVHASVAVSALFLIVPAALDWHVLATSTLQSTEYWTSVGLKNAVQMLLKGRLFDHVPEGRARLATPWFTVAVEMAMAWLAVRLLWSILARRERPDRKTSLAATVFVSAFLLFAGRDVFGTFVNLLPFSRSLIPFSMFFVHLQMAAIVLVGWFVSEVIGAAVAVLTWWQQADESLAAARRKSAVKLLLVLACVGAVGVAATPHVWATAMSVREDLHAQHTDFYGWWGLPLMEMLNETAQLVKKDPGRAYAGAEWTWGRQFDIKFVKMYALWTAKGLSVPNIGFIWHSLSHTAELDRLFDETRPDHHALFNVRYVLCHKDGLPQPFRRISEERVGHAVHEWTVAQGYFGLVQVTGCVDAWQMPRAMFRHEMEQFVRGSEHGHKRHPRVALGEWEQCREKEQMDKQLGEGEISEQTGSSDDFAATVDCREPRGCSVLVRIAYHPGFAAFRGAGEKHALKTFAVAPGYLAFVVPFGIDRYRVVFRTPRWRTGLYMLCLLYLALCAVGAARHYLTAHDPLANGRKQELRQKVKST